MDGLYLTYPSLKSSPSNRGIPSLWRYQPTAGHTTPNNLLLRKLLLLPLRSLPPHRRHRTKMDLRSNHPRNPNLGVPCCQHVPTMAFPSLVLQRLLRLRKGRRTHETRVQYIMERRHEPVCPRGRVPCATWWG